MKLRRDEFDALPESSSKRKGWRNRPPLKEVRELATYLHQFSFDELTEIVKSFIDDPDKTSIDESDNSATLRSSHGGQSETAKFICKGYDTVDASDGRISFRGFLQGFCGPHSETGGDCALSFSLGIGKEEQRRRIR